LNVCPVVWEYIASFCRVPGISLMRQSDEAAMRYLILRNGSIFFHSFFDGDRESQEYRRLPLNCCVYLGLRDSIV
jgi:hypothetical protein